MINYHFLSKNQYNKEVNSKNFYGKLLYSFIQKIIQLVARWKRNFIDNYSEIKKYNLT